MTTQEAIAYDNELKEKLSQVAAEQGFERKKGTEIVDNFVLIIPDDARKGMIFLGEENLSYKPGNIRFNLKNAITSGFEWAASLDKPENMFDYFQLLVSTICFIRDATKINLNKLEGYLIYYLHRRSAYNRGIEEEKLLEEFGEWYEAMRYELPDMKDIQRALSHLYGMESVDIRGGEVFLAETVVGEVK